MAKKAKPKYVNCRYPKCHFLHETTELLKDEAVQGGKQRHYYHPDCLHTMQTVNKIRDLFIEKVDPLLTGKQIGMLVSTINNIVFSKKVDVDFLYFTVQYFINYKPGALKHPAGLHYIIQDKDVTAAWKKEQERKIRDEMKEKLNDLVAERGSFNANDVGEIGGWEIPGPSFEYKSTRKSFSSVLGV